MTTWFVLVAGSVVAGIVCALKVRAKYALHAAGIVPGLGAMLVVVLSVYATPGQATEGTTVLKATLMAAMAAAAFGVASACATNVVKQIFSADN